MAYYPTNYYSNYPYQGGYNQSNINQQQQVQQIPQQQAIQYMPAQTNTLSGKIVDSVEVARVTDVPFGSYSVFPKADLSEIYIKSWNSNGTTNVITYKPVIEAKVKDIEKENEYKYYTENNEEIKERIDRLEEKIEMLLSTKEEKDNKRKEIKANAY